LKVYFARQHLYKIDYGGQGVPLKPPAWTSSAGLLLETRSWRNCDLNSLTSLREAMRSAPPYGRGFVPAVFHRYNPFWPDPEPFLSEYRGTLRITRPGLYRFFTSSQDASFLLIDGREVVAAPGEHGPVGDARFAGTITLSSGPHAFQYVHAAAGPDACMVAAWQPPGSRQPEPIPPEAFDSQAIARLPAVAVQHPREYAVEIAGEVPLAGGDLPLIRTQFRLVSTRATSSRVRAHWDFGDGQTSSQTDPVHIYLHPGLYTVTMKVPGLAGSSAVTNRVPVHRALVFTDAADPADTLASYLPIIAQYNPAKLDSTGLLQLVRALDQAGSPARAARAGQAGLLDRRRPGDSTSERDVARLVGSLLRDRVDDPEAALGFWQQAAQLLRPGPWKAECEIEAADLALHDLLRAEAARTLLDSATARLHQGDDAGLSSRLSRAWGDWYARSGDRPSARAAYARAMATRDTRRPAVEQDAWRGALSRSTEEFLRAHALDRARSELRRWQDEYPLDKIEGYLTLLQARCWAARGKFPQAIAMAADLRAINPDSPYADRLVFLAAECQEKLGRTEGARAGYHALLTDYPGSPLVGDARQRLAQLATKPAPGRKKP
jgi:tetratricopeptide (TPR) repeat protein